LKQLKTRLLPPLGPALEGNELGYVTKNSSHKPQIQLSPAILKPERMRAENTKIVQINFFSEFVVRFSND
jgi:hypothetical protein